ncbi:hypothetical protein J7L00_04195 [Candidatus Bathyarchaeota archaeon]|nr:hypothetical protein [Candidatus Bathyarchaeota archaeon]
MKLLDLALLIVAMEEARPQAIAVQVKPSGRKTRIKRIDNLTLTRGGSRYIYNSAHRGRLYEALVISNSPNFKVILNVDGIPELNASWSEINKITQEVTGITAFQRLEGDYALRISDILWLKSSYLLIVATDQITINKAYAKYEEETA